MRTKWLIIGLIALLLISSVSAEIMTPLNPCGRGRCVNRIDLPDPNPPGGPGWVNRIDIPDPRPGGKGWVIRIDIPDPRENRPR